MRYMMLIYSDETVEARRTPAENEAVMGEYFAFTEAARAHGVLQSTAALQPTATATTVCVRDGRTLASDGPFADAQEQLGGFYILDCQDLDEAIEWAARIPTAKEGVVEIRPILE